MTTITPAIVAAETEVDRADEALQAAIEALQIEYRRELASARAAEIDALRRAGEATQELVDLRVRSNRLAQVLTGAAGLAEAVLGQHPEEAADLARQVADAIDGLHRAQE